jgi:hypothetical protein
MAGIMFFLLQAARRHLPPGDGYASHETPQACDAPLEMG